MAPADDDARVDALAALVIEGPSVVSDGATARRLARLLLVGLRLERDFLTMLERLEQAARDSLGLDPYRPALDHTTIDWLYPENPRRTMAQIMAVEVENTMSAGTVRRGSHHVDG